MLLLLMMLLLLLLLLLGSLLGGLLSGLLRVRAALTERERGKRAKAQKLALSNRERCVTRREAIAGSVADC